VGSIPASRAKLQIATLRGGFFAPEIPQRDKDLWEFCVRRASSYLDLAGVIQCELIQAESSCITHEVPPVFVALPGAGAV
jgi:hypothetical protein